MELIKAWAEKAGIKKRFGSEGRRISGQIAEILKTMS